jgi:Flp pilus assembly protein TadG
MMNATVIRNERRSDRGSAHRRGERGAALVELAVVLPLLLVVLLGTIDFGRAFRTAMIVTNAARAGAQFGAQSLANAGNNSGIIAAADAVLAANGLASGPSPTPTKLCQCATNGGAFTDTSPVNNCSATCGGGHLVVSVTVTATRTFSMTTPFPGLPDSVTITRGATARAQ